MTWLLVAASVLLGVVAFRHFGSKPARHRGQSAEQFERFLTTLELCGRDGGLLFIEHEGSERFVQFMKLGDDPNDLTSLGLGVPDAPWSHLCFPSVRDALSTAGIRLDECRGTTGMRFLDADHLSVPRAAEAARRWVASRWRSSALGRARSGSTLHHETRVEAHAEWDAAFAPRDARSRGAWSLAAGQRRPTGISETPTQIA